MALFYLGDVSGIQLNVRIYEQTNSHLLTKSRNIASMHPIAQLDISFDKTRKDTDRENYKAMMTFVRAGDSVTVESISRIARNTRDLLSIISTLTEKGVEFISLKESIDTTTPHGRFMGWSIRLMIATGLRPQEMMGLIIQGNLYIELKYS